MDEINDTKDTAAKKGQSKGSEHTPECPYHHDCANCPLNKAKAPDEEPGC